MPKTIADRVFDCPFGDVLSRRRGICETLALPRHISSPLVSSPVPSPASPTVQPDNQGMRVLLQAGQRRHYYLLIITSRCDRNCDGDYDWMTFPDTHLPLACGRVPYSCMHSQVCYTTIKKQAASLTGPRSRGSDGR